MTTVTVRQADGTVVPVPVAPGTPVDLTGTGGSLMLTATGGNGGTAAGTIRWTCS